MKKVLLVLIAIMVMASSTISAKSIYLNPELICKEYKTKLYNITDYKKWDPKLVSAKKDVYNEFEKYFTKAGYSLFVGLRESLPYRTNAFYGKYNMSLKSITLKKDYENLKDGMTGFNYIVKINIKYTKKNKKDIVVEEKGYMNLMKESGKWKLIVDKVDVPFKITSLP